jgi:hypothetical protein
MESTARFLRLGGCLSALVILGWVLTGHAAPPVQEGLPTDWSHRHVIFSQPSTYEQVNRITSDPRYWQQWYRDNVPRALPVEEEGSPNAILDPASTGDWSENLGTGASIGAGNFPAKYGFQITTASCSDYVVFSTGLAGSSTQATVVGFKNLYSGCGGIVPTVAWAYNTGGQILTSPVISTTGGDQVAFVQTASSQGTLVLLKWGSGGTVGAPVTPTTVSNAAYRTCTSPCMTTILLKNGLGVAVDDTTSSVFPDYSHDIIWVGGASGWLHQITGVFRGSPAEVNTGGFPVQLSATAAFLSSPAHDQTSGLVFVGDSNGFLYRVTTGNPPVVTKSGQLDHGTGLVTGPIVDSTAEKVYVFSSSDGSAACLGGVPCSAVYLLPALFATGATGGKAVVGVSRVAPAPNPMYEGGVDSTYRASVNATGNLYVCGNTAGAPTIYQIPITAGVMGTVLTGGPLSGSTTKCSPVTDVPNPNATGGVNEWIFASAQTNGLGNNCAGSGCMMNFMVQPWLPLHAYALGQQILDTNLHVQVVRVAGTSKAGAHPAWNAATDGSTTDGGVRWTNQGPHAANHPAWIASHAYAAGFLILDSNNNVEWVQTAGTSRTAAQGHPVWSTTINGATTDNTVRWRNLGPVATQSVVTAGGASGIIIDNTVGSGTMAGSSQIYFSTLGNQTCTTSGGTGGCAVQASQSGLN